MLSVGDGGYLWYKVLLNALNIVHMAIYDPWNCKSDSCIFTHNILARSRQNKGENHIQLGNSLLLWNLVFFKYIYSIYILVFCRIFCPKIIRQWVIFLYRFHSNLCHAQFASVRPQFFYQLVLQNFYSWFRAGGWNENIFFYLIL